VKRYKKSCCGVFAVFVLNFFLFLFMPNTHAPFCSFSCMLLTACISLSLDLTITIGLSFARCALFLLCYISYSQFLPTYVFVFLFSSLFTARRTALLSAISSLEPFLSK